MSQAIYVRDAVVGKQYSYNNNIGGCGKLLGTLLKLTLEFDGRAPGGREPSYIAEFSLWKGSLEWDQRLRETGAKTCWT